MRTENIYCDLCHKKTTDEGVKKESLNGFCVELGYSSGGWGKRRDFTPPLSIEICEECFKKVKQKSLELHEVIMECKKQSKK